MAENRPLDPRLEQVAQERRASVPRERPQTFIPSGLGNPAWVHDEIRVLKPLTEDSMLASEETTDFYCDVEDDFGIAVKILEDRYVRQRTERSLQ